MKTTFLSFFWSFIITSLAFSNVTISGYLLDQNGEGISGHEITLKVNWDQNDTDHLSLTTANNGQFEAVFNRLNTRGAKVFLKFENCEGKTKIIEEVLPPLVNELNTKLEFCSDENEQCSVRVKVVRNNTGQTTLIAIGNGVGPFLFQWSDGSTGESIILPEDGKYCVTMTDANGCTATLCDEISEPKDCRARIIRIPGNSPILGFFLGVQFQPEDDDVKILWNTGDTTRLIRVDEPGRYCVKVIFSDGCIAESCVWIGTGGPGEDPDCIKARVLVEYASDMSYADLITQYSPNQNLEFLWSTGETTDQIRVTESGVYTVIITDLDNDCRIIRRVFVQLERCEVEIIVRETASGWVLTAVTPFSNSTPIRYLWSNGETTNSILVSDPEQTYCVVIITQNCRARACVVPSNSIGSSSSTNLHNSPADFSNRDLSLNEIKFSNQNHTSDISVNEIKLYPNPSRDFVYLTSKEPLAVGNILLITDLSGRVIVKSRIYQEIFSGEPLKIDLNGLNSGVYNISIMNGQTAVQSRLIVH